MLDNEEQFSKLLLGGLGNVFSESDFRSILICCI